MTPWSTYSQRSMDDSKDRFGDPWEVGTLRVNMTEKGTWAISPWHDRWWGTACGAWLANGEYFDGDSWKKISNYFASNPLGSLRHHLESLKNKHG